MPRGKARKAAWIKGKKNCPKIKKIAKKAAPAKPRQARASGLGMAIAIDKGERQNKIKKREEKKMKKLDLAKKAYQAEMDSIWQAAAAALAIKDYQRLAAQYQEDMAQEAAAKAEIIPFPKAQEKIRAKFPEADGLSPNGFSMRMASGQIDCALIAFRAAAGRYPNKAEGRQIIGLLNHFSIKPMPQDRLAEHIRFWQGPKAASHKKGNLYLD